MDWRQICGSILVLAACGDDAVSDRSVGLQNSDGSIAPGAEGGDAGPDAGIAACVPSIDPDAPKSLLKFDLPGDGYQDAVFGPKLCSPAFEGGLLTFDCDGEERLEVSVDPSLVLDPATIALMGETVLLEAREVILFEATGGTGFTLSVRSADNTQQVLWYSEGSLPIPAEGISPLTIQIEQADCEVTQNICNQIRGAALTVSDESASTTVNVQGIATVGAFRVFLERALRLEPLGSEPTCPSTGVTLATYLVSRVEQ